MRVYVCMCVLCVCVYVCMYARTPIAIFFMYANLTAYDAGPMRPSPCCATNLVGVVHMRSASPKAWGCENKDTLTHHILRSNHIIYSNFPSEPFKEFGKVFAISFSPDLPVESFLVFVKKSCVVRGHLDAEVLGRAVPGSYARTQHSTWRRFAHAQRQPQHKGIIEYGN